MMPDFFGCNLRGDVAAEAAWPICLQRSIELDESGLVLGAGTSLVRRDPVTHRLDLSTDRDRCLALLAVVCGRPVAAGILDHVEAAGAHWQSGDKALANLRLVVAGLPKLDDPAHGYRLQAAAYLLDNGLSPRDLMKELGFDPSAVDLGKYDPDQPRVPAGSGRESGRWTDSYSNQENDGYSADQKDSRRPDIVQIAADGPLKPGGMNVVPLPGIDPLDPKGLNKPLSPTEQQIIADTINTIIAPKPEDILTLKPHPYKNLPDFDTGAVLPPGIGGYTTYYA